MDEEESLPPDALDDAASVLLLAPPFVEREEELCGDLLHSHTPGDAGENVLWVSYTKSPDARLRKWRQNGGGDVDRVGVVSVGDSARSTAAAGSSGGDAGPITPVTDPGDLTGLGIAVNEFLSRWHGSDGRTVVCFHSLTAMFQYAELETAYEFLHVLIGRIHATDATVHFHMNPQAHDERTVESVATLVDAVVELDEDGGTFVRSS